MATILHFAVHLICKCDFIQRFSFVISMQHKSICLEVVLLDCRWGHFLSYLFIRWDFYIEKKKIILAFKQLIGLAISHSKPHWQTGTNLTRSHLFLNVDYLKWLELSQT